MTRSGPWRGAIPMIFHGTKSAPFLGGQESRPESGLSMEFVSSERCSGNPRQRGLNRSERFPMNIAQRM